MKKFAALCALLILFIFPMAGCNKNYELNDEMLSDIGKTRELLEEKYGPNIGRPDGGTGGKYEFQDGVCVSIQEFYKKSLFPDLPDSDTPEEIAEHYGVKLLVSRMDAGSVDSYFLKENVLIKINTTYREGIRTSSEISDLNYYNKRELGFDPSVLESRYQIFGKIAIGVPEGATIEDFLSDPLAQALVDTWETELEISSGSETVNSGKLTPGMWIYPDNNTAFKIIPYVKELEKA